LSTYTAFVAVEKREGSTSGEMKLREITINDITDPVNYGRGGAIRGGFGGARGRGAAPGSRGFPMAMQMQAPMHIMAHSSSSGMFNSDRQRRKYLLKIVLT
jgi:hypothetical protein